MTGEGFVRELMSKVMAAFCARYPGINVQMETVRAEKAVAHVVEDRAHLGWTLCPPAHPAVRIVHERPQPLCAIMAAAHPLAGQLRGCRWLPWRNTRWRLRQRAPACAR